MAYKECSREKQSIVSARKSLCLSLCTLPPPEITLLGDRKLGALALGKRNPGLDTLTDDENVAQAVRKMLSAKKP